MIKYILIFAFIFISYDIFTQSILPIPAVPEGMQNNYFEAGTGDHGSLLTYNSFLQLHYGLGIGSPYVSDGNGGFIKKATIAFNARTGDISTLGSFTTQGAISARNRTSIISYGSERALGIFGANGTGSAGIYFDAADGDITGNDYGSLVQSNDLNIRLKNHGNNKLMLSTNNHDRITITGDGKVGINTVSPETSLHLNNGTFKISGGSTLSEETARFIVDAGPSTGQSLMELRNNNEILVKVTGTRVGIGTSSPDSKLTVNGSIHAEEVKVDLTVPGPDYVFEPDYNLINLKDLKLFLKSNKHLPEVPSAVEMEKEGIKLSEMNMLLLKKIEELTLYTIQQQEQLDYQSILINKLIVEIEKLKTPVKK